MDIAERMVKEIMTSLSFTVPTEYMGEVELKIHSVVEKYEITEKSNELVTIDVGSGLRVLTTFLMSKKVEGLSDRTLCYYKNELMKFILSVNKPVENITTNDIRLFIAQKDCSNVTKDNTLRIIRSFFGWCAAEEYVQKNPVLRIKKIKSEKTVKKPFSELECEKLRNGARDERERAIIDVLLSTGCRIGEIEKMNREDIENDQLIVRGKGNKERVVYLNARAQVSIQNYLKTREDDNPALFVSEHKPYKRLKISGFESRIRELGAELGIRKVHPHRFRRTAATQALNRGMPIEQVQQMLGHANIETTLIYAQSTQESVKTSHKKYVI